MPNQYKHHSTTITFESELLGNLDRAASWSLVQLRHDDVSRMRDDGAEDTSDVASGECDDQLFLLAALVSRFGDDVLVQRLECALEARELHHRVRNLSAPQWHKTFVETARKIHDEILAIDTI